MGGCDGISQADSTQMREVHTQMSVPSQILTKLKAKRFGRVGSECVGSGNHE